ncbi:MAG: PilN domain-containing protein [Akkermansiaceae bacterium]|nr:PilN domain-containing protein [Armatimonadota bacterium]
MPNINLVAARREEKRQITTLSRQLFVGLIASGAILFAAIAGWGIVLNSQGAQTRELDAKLAELQPKIDRIEQRKKDIAALKPKVETLDNARISTLRWRAFMNVLAEATPSYVYYTSVTTAGDAANPSVSLKGMAPSNAIVGELSQRLSKNGNSMFEAVETPEVTNSSAPEDPVQKVTFDMNLYLRKVSLADDIPATGSPRDTPNTDVVSSAVKP